MSTPTFSDRDGLVAAMIAGYTPKWLFFWGHTAPAEGAIGHHVFSQWWPAPFEVDGASYATAEHWMMAEKARLFGDVVAERDAMSAGHPADAKAAGRLVTPFDEPTWRSARVEVVVAGNVAKFSQHPDLLEYLLGTGDRVLVEASPRDLIWGIGLGATNERATDPAQWRGQNLLGFALMEARDRLRRSTTG